MQDCKVSVVIPVYNTVRWMLKECFDSVLNQTFPVQQIVVVDDGSEDADTRACLLEYASRYPQRFLLYANKHAGIAKTRNTGIKMSTGDFVCFLDSDDYWLPDFVEALVNKISNETDIVFCGYQIVSFKGEANGDVYPPTDVLQDADRFPYYTCGVGSRLYRAAHLREYNCEFPEGCIMEDEAFSNIAIMTARCVECVESYGYCVRKRDDSFCRSRKSFNAHTVQSIPFMQFSSCLALAPPITAYQRDVLNYRVLHALMISSWVFCCFAPKQDQVAMIKGVVDFFQKENIDTSRLKNTLSRLHEPLIRVLALRVFIFSVRNNIERPIASMARFLVRMTYKIKGIY